MTSNPRTRSVIANVYTAPTIRNPYYRTDNVDSDTGVDVDVEINKDKRFGFPHGRRRRLIDMSSAQKAISSRDSIDYFDSPRSSLDFKEPNYESGGEETTTSTEEGYFSGGLDRSAFVKTSASVDSASTAPRVIGMPRSQLSVPEVRVRSYSTPSSPEIIRPSGKESGSDAPPYNAITTLSPFDNSLSHRGDRDAPIRKHSYDDRQRRSVDNEENDNSNSRRNSAFPKLNKRHTDLSLSTGSVRRRLPPTPTVVVEREIQFSRLHPPPSRNVLQQVKSSSYGEEDGGKRAAGLYGRVKFSSCNDEHYPSSESPESDVYNLEKSRKVFSTDSFEDTTISAHKMSLDSDARANGQQQQHNLRQGTGRKLPRVPDFSTTIKRDGYEKQHRDDEIAVSIRSCQTPPPPTAVSRVSSNSGYQPTLHTNGVSSPNSRKLCQRRTSDQSIEQYVGIACTCTTPSEKPESRSSGDTEEHDCLLSLDSRANSFAVSIASEKDDADKAAPKEVDVETPPFTYAPSKDIDKTLSSDDKSYGLGRLLFTVQYFAVRKRLRVNVIHAEGLAGRLKPGLELNTLAKVCLVPGKAQKQCGGRHVKGSRDAAYNEEFFFDNIGAEEMNAQALSICICHRNTGKQFQKDVLIGEIELPLNCISENKAKNEIKIQRELKPKLIKKLGKIRISTCLESESRRLTINVFKAEDLPKFGITGAPDPCVKITLDQNGRVQTKQTRILKSTCNAVFKEAVMFLVSVRPDDIDNADISICVMDTARNDVIGCVMLGVRAKEKSEIDQWKNTLANEGKEVKGSHSLRPVA